jgi:hypothetical protein
MMYNWIRYSGASISININPLHWRWVPQAGKAFVDEWVGPRERTYFAGWLFVTIKIWADDGSW